MNKDASSELVNSGFMIRVDRNGVATRVPFEALTKAEFAEILRRVCAEATAAGLPLGGTGGGKLCFSIDDNGNCWWEPEGIDESSLEWRLVGSVRI